LESGPIQSAQIAKERSDVMKKFFKFGSVIIGVAAGLVLLSGSRADDIVVKPQRYQSPAKSQFVEKAVSAQTVSCSACKNELVPTATQDTKLKTKTVLVAIHGCAECKTTVVRTGAHKATGKDVKQHTCGALMATVENCCGGMK
jgi:hypothetical protein